MVIALLTLTKLCFPYLDTLPHWSMICWSSSEDGTSHIATTICVFWIWVRNASLIFLCASTNELCRVIKAHFILLEHADFSYRLLYLLESTVHFFTAAFNVQNWDAHWIWWCTRFLCKLINYVYCCACSPAVCFAVLLTQ